MEQVVAVVGGTGAEGSGLALRFAKAGLRVLIGSRSLDRAQNAAREIAAQAGTGEVTGHTNPDAVRGAAIVILTVPLPAQVETLKSIRASFAPGAILVWIPRCRSEIAIGGRLRPDAEPSGIGSAACSEAARDWLPQAVPDGGNFSRSGRGETRWALDQPVDCDALICGDNTEAKATVSELAEMIPGVRAIDAGPLENARFLESAAALLIALNLRHRATHSGIRITGLLSHKGPRE